MTVLYSVHHGKRKGRKEGRGDKIFILINTIFLHFHDALVLTHSIHPSHPSMCLSTSSSRDLLLVLFKSTISDPSLSQGPFPL